MAGYGFIMTIRQPYHLVQNKVAKHFIMLSDFNKNCLNVSLEAVFQTTEKKLSHIFKAFSGENCSFAQHFFNAHQLIVFGDTLAAAGGARFNLTGIKRYGEISNRYVLSFAGAMTDNGGIAVTVCKSHCVNCFGKGADLVKLYQD